MTKKKKRRVLADSTKRRIGATRAKTSARSVAAKAIVAKFGSVKAWAPRTGKSAASVGGYLRGEQPCASEVAEQFRRDFPDTVWFWPAGISP